MMPAFALRSAGMKRCHHDDVTKDAGGWTFTAPPTSWGRVITVAIKLEGKAGTPAILHR
ncbi:hypothetical protein KCP78_21635 [Salmonella enterica subsp. enterica]|nr:hypothetical protein KCP78_21635 [Salmonella enterica subsp. enterica]